MSIAGKLLFLLGKNLKKLKRQCPWSPNDSAKACARHPKRKAIGVCKYCKRELCSGCLARKRWYFCCTDRDDCLRHPERCNVSEAEEVRKMLQEFSARPNAQTIDQLIMLVKDSADPGITSAILETFNFETTNFGVFGLALHCLGLVRDSRAIEFLIARFDALSTKAAAHPDPQVHAICTDHLHRAALSIITLICMKRDSNPKAIPRIINIHSSDVFPEEFKSPALHALNIFADTFPLARDYCQREFKKHT